MGWGVFLESCHTDLLRTNGIEEHRLYTQHTLLPTVEELKCYVLFPSVRSFICEMGVVISSQ